MQSATIHAAAKVRDVRADAEWGGTRRVETERTDQDRELHSIIDVPSGKASNSLA